MIGPAFQGGFEKSNRLGVMFRAFQAENLTQCEQVVRLFRLQLQSCAVSAFRALQIADGGEAVTLEVVGKVERGG